MKIVEQKIQILSCGNKLSAVLTTNKESKSDKIVVLLHGGPMGDKNGPNDIFKLIAEKLAKNRIDTMRFDFMGQGESGGDYINTSITTQQDDFHAVFRYIEKLGIYKHFGMVGESFGASCLLGVNDEKFKVLSLLWPAIYLMDNCFAPFFADEYKEEITKQGFFLIGDDKIGQKLLDEILKVDNYEREVRNIAVPTLIIHGDSDSEVPYSQSQKAMEILSGVKKLVTVAGGDHCLRETHEQEIVLSEVTEWLVRYM